MQIARRALLRLAAGATATLASAPRLAFALDYPSRPVHIVVGFAPGNASDTVQRLIAKSLSERLGQRFIVENRPGAGGTVAAEAVVRASPDGYTLLQCSSADAVNATIYKNLDYNFIRDVAPVASIASGPLVLVVNESFPAKTVPEFIAYAKTNPGKINFGSAGLGTVAQMAGELFKSMAKVELIHVPYRGLAPALSDLLGGQVQCVFSTTPPALGHIKSGKLRALAVTSTKRFAELPDLPTIADFLPGYEATITFGLGAPKNVPAEIVGKLHAEINAALTDPEMKARLTDLGLVPLSMTSAEFGELIAAETEKWTKVIRAAKV